MTLDPVWTIYDPLGDCTLDQSGGELFIAIPAGVRHDLNTVNKDAPRILQPCLNTDFSIETKLTTPVDTQKQIAGIVVEQDHTNMVHAGVYFDGANVNIYAEQMLSGSTTEIVNSSYVSPTWPIWIRLERASNFWSVFSSFDGVSFTLEGTFTFALTVVNAGLFAGTSVTDPAFTATFDYFQADNVSPYETSDIIDQITIESYFDATVDYSTEISDTLGIADRFDAAWIPKKGIRFVYAEWKKLL